MPDPSLELQKFLTTSKISTLELVMLELTNGSQTMESGAGPSVTLTSKSAYLWAGIIEAAARSSPDISWKDFRSAIERSITGLGGDLSIHYRNYDPLGPEAGDMRFFHGLLAHLRVNAKLSDIEEKVRSSYSALIEKGLIEDPLKSKLKRGIAVAVLSLVPVSFTNTTTQGKGTSLEVSSIVGKYEKSSTKGGTKQHFEFRLLKLVKAFQTGIVDVFSEAVADGSEPGTNRAVQEGTHAQGKKRARARK